MLCPEHCCLRMFKDFHHTLPETNSSSLKMMVSNRNLLFQGVIFRCHVSFREGNVHHNNGFPIILLMVQKSCVHQLRLVVYLP